MSDNLVYLPIDAITVAPGHNPRSTFTQHDLDRLAHAIATRGFNHPILVRSDHTLIDGERRLRAARQAGLTEIPALIADNEDNPLLDAFLANDLNSRLDPLEEAKAYQRLIDEHGLTRKGIAQATKATPERIRERLAILTLPERTQHEIADGTIPLHAIKALNILARIHPELPVTATKAITNADRDGWHAPPTWERLGDDPIAVAASAGTDDLPDGVFLGGHAYPADRFAIEAPEGFQVRFDRTAVEQAAALNAAHPSANGFTSLIVGQEVADQLAGDQLEAHLARERARSEASASSGPGAPTAQPRDLGDKRAARAAAAARNERLGTAVLDALARVKVSDARVARVLTAAPIASDLGRIARRGAALCLPGWKDPDTFLAGAKDAADVAGRCLVLLALARHADEEAVAMSNRSHYTLRFTGAPWRDEAGDLLDELLAERLPADVAEPIKAALDERAARRAEQARLAAERDAQVAQLQADAPNLPATERAGRIEALRAEYGFAAIAASATAELLALPEPATGPDAEALAA